MKTHYRTMEEPERIAKLPHYKGIPIPYLTLVDDNGIPHFKAVDERKTWQIKKEGRCSICGDPLDYWIAFMVTEKEAETKLIYENPNHEECLKYAFNVCPWLYYSKATYSDTNNLEVQGFRFRGAHPDREETNARPPKLGIYITNHYQNVVLSNMYRVCKVGRAKRLEWIEGK